MMRKIVAIAMENTKRKAKNRNQPNSRSICLNLTMHNDQCVGV